MEKNMESKGFTWTTLALMLLAVISGLNADDHSKIKSFCTTRSSISVPTNCMDLLCMGFNRSGLYTIYPHSSGDLYSVEVFCDQWSQGGGWTVFQRRMDGAVYFYRNWFNYKLGFGSVNAEFWLGNDLLSLLTSGKRQSLRIDLMDFDNKVAYAVYSRFAISTESKNYTLTVEGYSGDAGDGMYRLDDRQFSTYDHDNDYSGASCADQFKGAWWYSHCHQSNLNGLYRNTSYAVGVNWLYWRGQHYSVKTTEMKIRPFM